MALGCDGLPDSAKSRWVVREGYGRLTAVAAGEVAECDAIPVSLTWAKLGRRRMCVCVCAHKQNDANDSSSYHVNGKHAPAPILTATCLFSCVIKYTASIVLVRYIWTNVLPLIG